jgi:acyl transferase domain-containing protein/phosphopantetheinyl transferase
MTADSSPTSAKIAIIGMACVFPDAPTVHAFWRNIIQGHDAVGEPPESWDAARYLKSGRVDTSAGGYLGDLFRFEPHRFGIMPSSLDGGEPDQFLALSVAHAALDDAGYAERGYDHRDTGVILGHSTYLHRGQGTLIQNHIVVDQTIELLRAACPTLGTERVTEIRELLEGSLPACNTDIAPGLVPNVMTGRIANRLDLRGPNYLVDAACSSSLLAVAAAMDELRAGRSDMMLAGGVNASLPPEVAAIFTQLGALSRRGRVRPFETGSDGTLLGEGLGVVVLKRLDDAMRDDDRIYAVIRGVGQASDGRGKGLLAPTLEGEALAIRRAYEQSGVDPKSVSLVEAHGTGIPLGDRTEIGALRSVFGDRSDAPCLPVGSVKSMISHCIPAAGVAGLIKCALAIHHRTIPPTLCEEVNPELGIEAPLYVPTTPTPWIHPPENPRRAGVDSFGFGGINTHAILEEAPAEALRPDVSGPRSAELCVLSAPSKDALIAAIEALVRVIDENPEWTAQEIACAMHRRDAAEVHRLAFVVADREELRKALERAEARLRSSEATTFSVRSGLSYAGERDAGQLAFVFPGEGSQYVGMLEDLTAAFDDAREWFDVWSGVYAEQPGHRRTDIVWPPASVSAADREVLEARLHDMDVGSEAVFFGAQAVLAVLRRLGVTPDAMLGHSSGESSALLATHAIPWARPADVAEPIRRLNEVYRRVLADGDIPRGRLLAIGAMPIAQVRTQAESIDTDLVVAMHNCADQVVVFGPPASADALEERLTVDGAICVRLPFDRGYHTPAFAAASDQFRGYYDDIEMGRPETTLYSCASADRFPEDDVESRALAASQWSQTVRFTETVGRMVDDGLTTFVEVGPSANLTSFIQSITRGTGVVALPTDNRRRGSLRTLLATVGQLYTQGRPLALEQLFEGRSVAAVDLEGSQPDRPRTVVLDNSMPKIRLSAEQTARLRTLTAPPAQPVVSAGPVAVLPPSSPASVATPLLDDIVVDTTGRLQAKCRLDVEAQAFLRDHILTGEVSEAELRGLSCMPLMVSLEVLAEACATLAGSVAVRSIEHVQAFAWIALDHGSLELDVEARCVDARTGRYEASIRGEGGVAVRAQLCFSAKTRCRPLPPLQEWRESIWNDDELYTSGMFHGPLFQSVRHIEGWDEQGIDTRLAAKTSLGFLRRGHAPQLVLDPITLDAMGQVAAYWIAQYAGVQFNAFPSTLERLELYRNPKRGESGLRLRARQRPDDPRSTDIAGGRSWDFECLDRRSRPLFRAVGLRNAYFPVPVRFYNVRRQPLTHWLGRPVAVPGRSDVSLWELPMLSEQFLSQSEGVFGRILASIYLDANERAAFGALECAPRRRRQWLLGRAAIKEAVRAWIYHHTGELLHASAVSVAHDELGAPYVTGAWADTLIAPPSVSLSHDAQASVVAVSDSMRRVGVDRESLDKARRPDLLRGALSSGEQMRLEGFSEPQRSERLLRHWCAKEAAAKFLGCGLRGDPPAFEVCLDASGDTALVLHQHASVHVDLMRDGDTIVAVASPPTAEIIQWNQPSNP